jgi:site-specific DNA recombinase
MRDVKVIVGYCRVSTDNQKGEGTIEIQERALQEHAQENGYTLAAVFRDDGVSGGLENRPGLAEMFAYLQTHHDAGAVIIYKLDRLARDLYIQEHLIKELEALDVRLISIKEKDLDSADPMRKAFRQFMGIVSELEKAFITMRLSGGRINKARNGGYAGGAPAFGYTPREKELEIDAGEAEIVREIFCMKRRQRMSLGRIARELNERQVRTARGGKWYARTVKNILENPIYKGRVSYKGQKSERKELAVI